MMFVSPQKLLTLLDLTLLGDNDRSEDIAALCVDAVSPQGNVAAVCIQPPFVTEARQALPPSVAVATVVNFPTGEENPRAVFAATRAAIAAGANEIDAVFPYRAFAEGETSAAGDYCAELVQICHEHGVLLKMILETGALAEEDITATAQCAVRAGVDFLKTSTGKIPQGASLTATGLLLAVIKESPRPVGLKIAGGVREIAVAQEYLAQAAAVMGEDWLIPSNVRIGASSLLSEIKKQF